MRGATARGYAATGRFASVPAIPGPLLAGKVAVVTGGGGGIGSAVSETFAAHGAAVVVADVDERRAMETVAVIEANGGLARAAGLSDDEIARVAKGPDEPGWDTFEASLLRAADELRADSVISDPTWAALAERYGERQLIEVCMLVGQYHLVAFTLNSLGIEREPGVEGLPV